MVKKAIRALRKRDIPGFKKFTKEAWEKYQAEEPPPTPPAAEAEPAPDAQRA